MDFNFRVTHPTVAGNLMIEETTETISNLSSPVDNYIYLNDIRQKMLIIVLPVIVLLGTVGNVLAFCVLIRRRMRAKSVYFYLAVLACADTSVLYVSAFKAWIRFLTGFELMHISSVSCKLSIFLILCSQHVSAWMVVFLTVDRFLSIWCPFFASWFCTLTRARVMTLVLVCVISAYNVHVFWTFQLIPGKTLNTRPMCTIEKVNPFHYIFDYIKTVTYCLLPSCLVFILNTCIIYKVSQRKNDIESAFQGKVERGASMYTNKVSFRKNRVTTMLLVISFVWLFLTTPYGILSISRSQFSNYSPSLIKFIITITFLLFYLNHSVNFYLYCLTGQKIRTEFCDLFQNLFLCGRKERTSLMRRKLTQRTPVCNHGNDIEMRVSLRKSPGNGYQITPQQAEK